MFKSDVQELELKNETVIKILGVSRSKFFEYKSGERNTPPYIATHLKTLKLLKLASPYQFDRYVETISDKKN